MKDTALLLIFELHAFALLVSGFCRMAMTSKQNTRPTIRWVFTMLSLVAATCVVAPVLFDYRPDWVSAALVAVFAYTQIVTSYHWRRGVPTQFLKEGCL